MSGEPILHQELHFLQIANGSFIERQTQLEMASPPGFVSNHAFAHLRICAFLSPNMNF